MQASLQPVGIQSLRVLAIQSLLSFMLFLGETIGIWMVGAAFSNKLNHSLSIVVDCT